MDIFGNLFKAGPKSVAPTKTVGQSGPSGLWGDTWTQTAERSPKLQGAQRYLTYSDMLANTSIVATGTRYFLNIIANASWSVAPACDADGDPLPGAQEVADLVESVMHDMTSPWYSCVRRAGMSRFYGYSVQEWTAKRREDGKIGMLDVEPRPQSTIERWDVDPSGSILGVWQRLDTGGEVYLPRNKIVYAVDNTLNDTPEGLGLFRHLVDKVDRLKAFEELEEIAYETDLRGIPVARAPLAAIRAAVAAGKIKADEATKMLRPLENFAKHHIRSRRSGLLLDSSTYKTEDDAVRPSGALEWDVSLLQGSSTSQEAVANAIMRVNREMALLLSIEHLLLGSDGTGSLALGSVKTNDFYMVANSCLGEIRQTNQQDFVSKVCRLNGIPQPLWPQVKTENVQFKDVEAMARTLKDMATAGAVLDPNDPAINEMRDLLGLSPAPPVEEIDDEDMALTGEPGARQAARKPKDPDDKSIRRSERGQE